MHPPDAAIQLFRFGPFELNAQTGELRRNGVRVRLPDQSCTVLLALLRHSGEMVSREELQQQLWKSGTFVDFEHGLNLAVARLRQSLADVAENPRYIETVPRKGYRFVGRLEPAEEPSAEVVSGSENALPRRETASGLFRRRSIYLGSLAAVVGIVIFWREYKSQPPALFTAVPLTSYAGSQLSPSFAPDGGRVAFSWQGEKQDNFDIYVKQIGTETPLRLTTDPRPDLSPAWSPDGSTIAFLRIEANNRAEVLLTPSLVGGPERRLAEVAAPWDAYWNLRFLSWSPDGRWLVVSDARAADGAMGLLLLSPDSGERRELTLPPPAYGDFDPAFSPDMKRLAFVRHSGDEAADMYMLDLDARLRVKSGPVRLTFDHRRTSSPVWAHDGRSLLFTRYSLSGRHSLWRLKLSSTSQMEPVPVSADNAFALAISARGDRFVYTREIRNSNIWSIDLSDDGRRNATRAPQLFISSSRREMNPSFSPDGQKIVFQSDRTGWIEIWMADRDGSHQHPLTELRAAVAGFPRWSPDGTRIAFHMRQETNANIFVLAPGGRPRQLTYGTGADMAPSWSQDGKWIYFESPRSGTAEIWKIAADGGTAMQLTHNGGHFPLESFDGKFVFYTKSENGIWRTPVSGGKEQQMLTDPVAGPDSVYAPVPKGIYFIRDASHDGSQPLGFYSFATGQITKLTDIARPVHFRLAVSPDERTILYSQLDHDSSDLMLVDKFR